MVCSLGATLVFGILLGRRLLGSTAIGVLTAGAMAICGASAAMALASVLPVVALVGIYFGRREGGRSPSLLATVPWFLLVFAALVIVISLHWVPPPLITAMQDTSRWCLVVAIAGLGVKTSIQQLAQVGWRPIAVLLANTVFLAVFAGALLARA